MNRRAPILFLVLAAVWGASYMFIKVALEDGVPPAVIVFLRTVLAALVLWPVAARMGALAGLLPAWRQVGVLAAVQVAAPFMLISFGEQEIPSAMTGILVASAPIFTFLLAFAVAHEERASAPALGGVAIGLVGVALLLGVDLEGGAPALAGGLMVVLASLGYALGAFYLKGRFAGAQPIGIVTATMTASALMTLPLAALDPPGSVPGTPAATALIALGVLGTGLAFVIYYRLIRTVGASRASLVAYVAPGFSILYGVALLDERFTLATAAGLALIVGGSWLAAGGRVARRRLVPAPEAIVPAQPAEPASGGDHLPRRAAGG